MDVINRIKVSSRAQDISGGKKRPRTSLVQIPPCWQLRQLRSVFLWSCCLSLCPHKMYVMLFRWLFPWLWGSQQWGCGWLEGCRHLDHLKSPLPSWQSFSTGVPWDPWPLNLMVCVHRDFGLDFGWKTESDNYWSRYISKQLCSIFWITQFVRERNWQVVDGALSRAVVL